MHWPNPYPEAVPVTLEELAECVQGLDLPCWDTTTTPHTTFTYTKDKILQYWRNAHPKLDAYILPQPSGWHDIGVRYGSEPHQYLSPPADKERTAELLKRKISKAGR